MCSLNTPPTSSSSVTASDVFQTKDFIYDHLKAEGLFNVESVDATNDYVDENDGT